MSAKRKTPAKVQQAKGAVKENVGRAVGNEDMAAEGRTERAQADLREAGRKAKDAFKR
ncbi:CsbD family protein [Streptomyces sp. TRM76323]|uniref:CsbD family protein n=1 Tax=Streptomyces tamarix TaxID=3078565 RepID=A0ABU3QRN7_9ACTN|nr:CsbD family protein [Streptomyces tamarix]MDT9685382.1 CsbD family protein [Streptomyces tamarix]